MKNYKKDFVTPTLAGVVVLLVSIVSIYFYIQRIQNQPVIVSEMSKYIDSDFGFSFWYPNDWQVINGDVEQKKEGGSRSKNLIITGPHPSGNGKASITMIKFKSSTSSLTESVATKLANGTGKDQKYFFDFDTKKWMQVDLTPLLKGELVATTTADISRKTMGGLPMLPGGLPDNANVVIPINTQSFLIIGSFGDNYIDGQYLVNTIVPIDPLVATPVSTWRQIKIIEAEKEMYIKKK